MKSTVEKNKGITLIALVVTIIVLLILAGISISMLVGENGILNRATEAKEKNSIGEEKEQLSLAYASAKMGKYNERVSAEDLQVELDKLIGENKANAQDNTDDSIIVLFDGTNNSYTINDGKIEKTTTMPKVEDKTPGEFEGDGSENNPYQISSIEDLVGLSKKVENGERYEGKYFILTIDLDFNSANSYVDATRKDFDDVNKDDTVDELKKELTSSNGFIPIGHNENKNGYKETYFDGIFNGDNHTIYNLYEYDDAGKIHYHGLFGRTYKGITVKNLNLENVNMNFSKSTGSNNGIGGILGEADQEESIVKIENCSVSGRIIVAEDSFRVGGIVGSSFGTTEIKNCINYASINSCYEVGGIIGQNASRADGGSIENCTNYGNIVISDTCEEDLDSIGGIVGENSPSEGKVKNCINYGNINAYGSSIGGICGYNDVTVENCINKGNENIKKDTSNQIGGIIGQNAGDCINCFNSGKITTESDTNVGGIVGQNGWESSSNMAKIKNCYNIGEIIGKTNIGGIAGINLINIDKASVIENSYYLKSTTTVGYTNDTGSTSIDGSKDITDMKNDDFITSLNSGNSEIIWKKDNENKNNGYPILNWQ